MTPVPSKKTAASVAQAATTTVVAKVYCETFDKRYTGAACSTQGRWAGRYLHQRHVLLRHDAVEEHDHLTGSSHQTENDAKSLLEPRQLRAVLGVAVVVEQVRQVRQDQTYERHQNAEYPKPRHLVASY
jgi:hypothetical protein